MVTGLRISELTNLKICDVSPDGGQILVNGKGSRERMVFVPIRLLQDEFKRYCEARREEGPRSAPLFLNTESRRFRHSAATLLI
ncbi:tyrosine-type recombinase/integrase [Sulfitobacter sp. D35]|uniref:tyrosine-type recombinase/integrase n=1 Tax=Sulfitobacter sp. D35 TaxID=3083252 RepID=UPI00296F2C26|nr:tyrosine-type recombinase/integrase [Sulfitobacter sp. D35]MDW4500209.1 tyrosine-type recombinase/integrase [Sulfitobacter sp. D35]